MPLPTRPRLLFLALLISASPGRADGLTPEVALKRFRVPDGFEVRLYASEPMVRQPVTMTFDGRGRVWVIQYLQYPNPAGLKPVKVDRFLRTVYDRVPEPPPKGPKGADKVTVLEDTDGDGRADKAKDFVTGLNLASGLALGHGGVYVLQAPYLLFYPDRDRDDVPDGDPEVLLSGFGMEDAHAVANSLQWGPDGWLYGAQGSTVTANVRGAEFQQGLWRYHPLTKKFELFCEGGGNTWGLDFDRRGQAIAGTNYGNVVMLHQVQGAYYVKNFGKHGALHNPHAYGYFEHVPYADPKYLHSEHVTPGGIVYQGDSFPKEFHDQYVACSLLRGSVFWHKIERHRSTFKSGWGGELLTTDDRCFRPIDCCLAPDGSVFVVDWYDPRSNHGDPIDNWDKTTGRIYQVVYRGTKPARGLDLDKQSTADLVVLLGHPNAWFRREARRIFAERRDASIRTVFRQILARNKGAHLFLEALWALYVSGGFDEEVAETLLGHANEDVRAWTVRLLGDDRRVSEAIRKRLVELARSDPSPTVRNQLACTCKRLPAADGLPILRELLKRDEDADAPQIPLLLWWAVEDKAVSDREQVLGAIVGEAPWRVPMVARHVIDRLGRRYAAEGTAAGDAVCARLLAVAPGQAERERLMQEMEKEFAGRRLTKVPAELEQPLAKLWGQGTPSRALVRFALALGSDEAHALALKRAADRGTPEGDRLAYLDVVGQAGRARSVEPLLGLLRGDENDKVRLATLAALQGFAEERVAPAVLDAYPKWGAAVQSRARDLLAGRRAWAVYLLRAVDAGRIDVKTVPADQVRPALLHNDAELDRLVEKHWGKLRPAAPGELQARIVELGRVLRQGTGDPVKGKALFTQHCATCHQLFGEGQKVGPDLTGADRRNRDWMLANVVDPSSAVRTEYQAVVVEAKDGRFLTGLIAEATPQAVTLVDAKNQRTTLARDRIEKMEASPVSLMPEKLLDTLPPQEVRDLFAYLQLAAPPEQP